MPILPPMTNLPASSNPTVTVFFDGSCPLCRREIQTYRNAQPSTPINWVDVSALEVDAGSQKLTAGRSCSELMSRFHVQTADGSPLPDVLHPGRVLPIDYEPGRPARLKSGAGRLGLLDFVRKSRPLKRTAPVSGRFLPRHAAIGQSPEIPVSQHRDDRKQTDGGCFGPGNRMMGGHAHSIGKCAGEERDFNTFRGFTKAAGSRG